MATYVGVFFSISLFVQYFASGQYNYFCKVPIMYRIMGEAGDKCVISTMQGDSTITDIQHTKICVQEVTTQYNGIHN